MCCWRLADRICQQDADSTWRDKIRERIIGLSVRFLDLLTQETECRENFCPQFVSVKFNIIPNAISWENSVNTARLQQFLRDNFIEKLLGIREKFRCFHTVFFMFQNRGITSAQFP